MLICLDEPVFVAALDFRMTRLCVYEKNYAVCMVGPNYLLTDFVIQHRLESYGVWVSIETQLTFVSVFLEKNRL